MAFDPREATISTVHDALFSRQASCREIVQAFLKRIEVHNPKINAIISLNPHALVEADEADNRLASGSATGKLFGIPILLKDNFDAVGMPTTAGSRALRDAWPTKDAATVTALRRAGAIILGKANLHEFALEGLTVSSFGGQTLNPYDFTRTPGGSSGGSGAAVAASFAVMATGTDTVNSLRSPASANSLYSFRPTRGLLPCAGVVPVGSTQDAVGMIGRSLSDIAVALTVMSTAVREDDTDVVGKGYVSDIATNGGSSNSGNSNSSIDYTHTLRSTISGCSNTFRIGVLRGFIDSELEDETEPVTKAIHKVLALLRAAGTTVIDIEDTSTFNAPRILSTTDVQMYEIGALLDEHLSSPNLKGNYPRTFDSIYKTNLSNKSDEEFLVIPGQYSYIKTALKSSTSSQEYKIRKNAISSLTQALHNIFRTHALDAIIYPQQRNLVVPVGSVSQHGRNGILAAVTGSPVICIPIGFSSPTATAPIGLPVGMEILGMPWMEGRILEVAQAIDRMVSARKPPVTSGLSEKLVVPARYETVPQVIPMGLKNVDRKAYPPGRLIL